MTKSNQKPQVMEDGLIPVNLFDAVPYIAQTRFENEYIDFKDVTFQDIQKGIRQIYKIISREFPSGQFYKDHYFKTIRTMLYNAVELCIENSAEYNKYCRVNTDKLNSKHNIEYYL